MKEKVTNMDSVKQSANPMGKIILMVGIAIVVFLVVTTFSIQKSVQSSGHLTQIKDLYFPVLERVDANIVRLDKMEERYMQAVMTGEHDQVDEAGDLYSQADTVFEEMDKLYPARTQDIDKLRADFKQYMELASKTSNVLMESRRSLNKNQSSIQEQTSRMNQALKALRQAIKDFRQSSYENFVKTLGESQQAVKLNLYMGIALGIMNLLFMGVLVFFIRNNVKMMSVIAEQNATLELRVAERTAQLSQKTNDINAMLHNMKLGVCTVVPGNFIHPEYSSYMKTIFGVDDLAGRGVLEALFASSTLGVDTKDQIEVALGAIVSEDAMMFDFNGHLLVREMQIEKEDGSRKILQLDWSPIVNESDVVDKVLLIVQDVTHLRELELASANQKEELDIIAQIIKISIGKFNDFIVSAHKFIAENGKLIQESNEKNPEVIAALFRNMHTIKGNARTYEFKLITDAAHAAEQEYDHLRKNVDAQWDSQKLLTELNAVEEAIGRYVEVNEDKLGRKGRASDLLTARGVFVSNEEIAELRVLMAEHYKRDSGSEVANIRKVVDQLGLIPLQRLVLGSVDSLSSLAKELNKPTPATEMVNGEIAFNAQFAEALKSSFMHIVRNSLDHGIESPEARRQAQKAEQGKINFVYEKNGDQAELHIFDDGRGLALHKLYEKGVAQGIFGSEVKPTHAEVADLIFHSGLSTAEQVTQVSGRGVGMDAVRSFLKELGSNVRIELNQTGTEFAFTPFKFVIHIPNTAFIQS
jgi:ElaB/YqjD/DUF883 family membrane-anchored ribosome-binding protein/HPt (histidine-containing phosphotransfer) domain-containing protein